MDVNGFKGPNSEARNGKQYDIRSFKVAKFSKGCAGVEVPNIGCVYQLPSWSPIKAGDPEMGKWDPNWKNWNNPYYSDLDNYWAGIKKACDDIGMSLPELSKLQSIYQAGKKDSSLGLPTDGYFWSSSEVNEANASYMNFTNGDTNYYNKFLNFFDVLCVGD